MQTKKENLLVIGITGRTCSGKSFMLETLKHTNAKILNLDKELDKVLSKEYRKHVFDRCGIETLETITRPIIDWIVKGRIESLDKGILFIEGVDCRYLKYYCDSFITFDTPDDIRKSYAKEKGWSEIKFEEIDKLYDRLI